MADKRINALANTAPSTASDDFIAVDGTTNGTRKLNAFSPTFGGNVVVTGTLTSQSTLSTSAGLICQNADITGGYITLRGYSDQNGGLIFLGQSSNNNFIQSNATTIGVTIAGTGVTQTVAAGFRVLSTTASTSTSTGALVVGNGTSGGLGVGGSIYAGDNINSVNAQGKIQIQGTGNTTGVKEINLLRSDGGDACTIGLTGSAYNGVFLAGGLGNNEAFIYNAAPFRVFIGTAATNRFDFTSSQFKINPTTICNSTTTGALVVAGGVGVGGAINAGGDIATASTMRSIGFHVPGNGAGRPANTDSYLASTATTQIPLYVSGYTGGGQSADILRVSLNSTSDWFSVKGNGQVSCFATTASTSTSSGALVVSGGVGVAGAMNVGGSMKLNYFSTAGDPTALGVVQLYATTNTTSGAGGIEWKADAGGNGYGYRTLTVFDGVSAYDLYTQVRTNSASWTNSVILKSNGNATFSGSVQTSAPSGGTAAAWKLGTVATVSPTSPNRTIEVDIGGTIYYIHAKTTNN